MGMRIAKEKSGTHLLLNVLWGRVVAEGIPFCSKGFHCTNTPSSLVYRTMLQSCVTVGEVGVNLLVQLVCLSSRLHLQREEE